MAGQPPVLSKPFNFLLSFPCHNRYSNAPPALYNPRPIFFPQRCTFRSSSHSLTLSLTLPPHNLLRTPLYVFQKIQEPFFFIHCYLNIAQRTLQSGRYFGALLMLLGALMGTATGFAKAFCVPFLSFRAITRHFTPPPQTYKPHRIFSRQVAKNHRKERNSKYQIVNGKSRI